MIAQIKSLFKALQDSGNILYQGYPAIAVPIADDAAWDELFIAAGAPAVPYWLCGFTTLCTNAAADHTLLIDIGYGGADGAATAPLVTVVTNFPFSVSANAVAIGPNTTPPFLFPYPIKIPAASRMAARIASSPTGGIALVSLNVILATVVDN